MDERERFEASSPDVPPADPTLRVEFAGTALTITPDRQLEFGRLAELAIDDNPYMHRVVGRFVFRNGLWWLQNTGARIVLEVADRAGASLHTIKPEGESPLHFEHALVRFHAARTGYELEVSVDAPRTGAPRPAPLAGTETITVADLPMTRDQLRLVLALAEPALLDPYAREPRIPSNRQAALRLGWTLTRFNRKLDNVCQKLAKRGIPGLHGDIAELAVDRRRRLVDYAVESGLVTIADLALLDQSDGAKEPE